jgi:uncharacterized protein (DUF488 family)
MRTLYTLGYEGLSASQFLHILQAHSIERVIDIRRNPISRKSGFSKVVLQSMLADAGMHYTHVVELGTPNDIRNGLRASADYDTFFDHFEEYLETQVQALHAVLDLALTQQCGLLCFERTPEKCHRMSVAAYLARMSRLQLSVEHIRL